MLHKYTTQTVLLYFCCSFDGARFLLLFPNRNRSARLPGVRNSRVSTREYTGGQRFIALRIKSIPNDVVCMAFYPIQLQVFEQNYA